MNCETSELSLKLINLKLEKFEILFVLVSFLIGILCENEKTDCDFSVFSQLLFEKQHLEFFSDLIKNKVKNKNRNMPNKFLKNTKIKFLFFQLNKRKIKSKKLKNK